MSKFLLLVIVLHMAICAAFSLSMNPITDDAGVDSSVFAYVGNGIANGLLPYRDMFDHKGPLLYLINYAGMCLNIGYQGVWVVELILFFTCVTVSVMLLRPIINVKALTLSGAPLLWLFIRLSCGGNMSETYSLYISMIAWAALLKDIYLDEVKSHTILLQGFAAGCILCLRPNMLGFCVPTMLILIWDLFTTKNIGRFLRRVACGVCGLLIVLTPIAYWLYRNEILEDCWNCYIGFNVMYMRGLQSSIDSNIYIVVFVLALNIILLRIAKGRTRCVLRWNLVCVIFSALFIAMKLNYRHYYLPILSSLVFPLAYAFSRLLEMRKNAVALICALLFVPLHLRAVVPNILNTVEIKSAVLQKRIPKIAIRHARYNISPLKKLIMEEDTVLVLGNACDIYYRLGVRAKGRFFYTSVVRFSDQIKEEVQKTIAGKVNKFVVLRENDNTQPESIITALHENYHVAAESDGLILYVSNIKCIKKEGRECPKVLKLE